VLVTVRTTVTQTFHTYAVRRGTSAHTTHLCRVVHKEGDDELSLCVNNTRKPTYSKNVVCMEGGMCTVEG